MANSHNTAFRPDLEHLAKLARALAHPGRLRIIEVLAARETCVCGDIVDALPLAQSTVSQHLKELKGVGLIQGAISGPRTCYCLDRNALADASEAFTRLFANAGCCRKEG